MNIHLPRRVCLVSGGHPSSNPRLVKEADALIAAGYEVTVVHAQTWRPGLDADATLRAKRSWKALTAWDGPGTVGYTVRRLLQRSARAVFRIFPGRALPWAVSPVWASLQRRALGVEADLYIGHTLVALPVVAACAKAHRARYAFDVEDFHPGEQDGSKPGEADWDIAECLFRDYLPDAAFVTASSPLIGEEVASRYGVQPTVILNVFDPDETDVAPVERGMPTFYWFSQTIGPGRGIEDVISLLGALKRPVALELRGVCNPDYRRQLESLARTRGAGQLTLEFLPTASADFMVHLARGYTAGISSEQNTCLNKQLCLGNKIFTYLAAGTPVLLTPTRAQVAMARELGNTALVLEEAEAGLQSLLTWLEAPRDPASMHAVRETWSWRSVQRSWLDLVEERGFSSAPLRRA